MHESLLWIQKFFNHGFLIPPLPLTNFNTQRYYRNKDRLDRVYSRDNLTDKIKDEVYEINLGEYSDIGFHWIALHALNNNVTYFDSFGVEYISKEKKLFVCNKNIQKNLFRIQAYDSVMCGYFCIGFIDFMFKCKSFTDFTNLFSPNYLKKNDDITLNYFKVDKKF